MEEPGGAASSSRRALFRRTMAFASGNLAYAAGQFILLVLLARLGSPLILGLYTLATALLNPAFFLSKLGMRQAQATEKSNGFPFAVYMRVRSAFLALAVLAGLAMLPVFAGADGTATLIFCAVLGARAIESLSDIYYGLLLRHERQDIIGVSMILRSVSAVASFLLVYALTRDAALSLLGLPAGWALIYVFHDLMRSRAILSATPKISTSWREAGRLLGVLWPLALVGLFAQLGQGLPRYMVGWDAGAEILGQIAPALQFHVLVGMLAQSISQSLLPGVARDIADGKARQAFRRLTRLLIALLPLIGLGIALCLLFGAQLVRLVFGTGYDLAGDVLWIVSLSWSIRACAILYQNLLLGQRDFRRLLALHGATFAAYLLAIGLLTAGYGLIGTMWGMVLGSTIQFCAVLLVSRRQLPSAPVQHDA